MEVTSSAAGAGAVWVKEAMATVSYIAITHAATKKKKRKKRKR